MQLTPTTRARRRAARLDVALLATAGGLLLLTLLPYIDPALNIVIKDRTLDVALTSLTMIGTAGLAALAVMRYRETGRLASFVQASAFALWFTYTAVTVVLVVLRLDGAVGVGLSLGLPEQLPPWASGITRIAVAGLFMVSGVAALRGIYGRARRRTRRIFVPAAIVVAVTIVLYLIRIPFPDVLPALIEPEGIQALLAGTTDIPILPGVTPLAFGMAVATVTGLVAAVVLYRITWVGGGPASDSFTAVGLVILAVAEVQHALWPSVYSGLVTASDIMRLAAYIVLAAGVIADQRSDLRALRSAYTALDRMRTTEAERADPGGAFAPRARDPRWAGAAPVVRQAQDRAAREHPVGGGATARGRGHPGARHRHRRGARGARDDALGGRAGHGVLRHARTDRRRLR